MVYSCDYSLQYEHRPSNSFLSLGFHGVHLMCHLSSWGKWCGWVQNTNYTMNLIASCHKFNGWRFKSSVMLRHVNMQCSSCPTGHETLHQHQTKNLKSSEFMGYQHLFTNTLPITWAATHQQEPWTDFVLLLFILGDHSSTVVKALCCKLEGHWFNPSWCQWIFHWQKIFPIALWPWGRLSLQHKWEPRVLPGGKGGRCVKADNLPPSCAAVTKSGNLNFLRTLWACPGL